MWSLSSPVFGCRSTIVAPLIYKETFMKLKLTSFSHIVYCKFGKNENIYF